MWRPAGSRGRALSSRGAARRRSRFSGALSYRISRSNVRMGAPSSCAATPPTTKKSTPCRSRTRRSPRNLTLGDSPTPELRKPIHPILQKLDPLERRQAEGPADQREIDTVGRLLRQERVWRGLGIFGFLMGGLGHGSTIAQAHTGP